MPNKHAAEKDLRKNRRRAALNVRIRKNVKYLWKQSRELLVAGKKSEAVQKIQSLQQALDKAAKVNVIHRNEARRRTRTMMKMAATATHNKV